LKRSARLAFVGLAVILSMALAVQPATAHAPSNGGVVYTGSDLCTISNAQIAFDHAAKVLSASARTDGRRRSSATSACDTIDVWQPGWLAVNFTLYKWSLKRSQWEVCTTTPWVYNTSGTWQVVAQTNYGTNYPCWDPTEGATPQRPTYYYTASSSWVWDGAAWRGGSKVSGYHPIPA
jgi:hypothetical protein